MSIQTELSRIINAKAAIKAAIEGKGVTVPEATLLDGMAAMIESIEAGGGMKVIQGTFTPAENTISYTIEHKLGKMPRIYCVMLAGNGYKAISNERNPTYRFLIGCDFWSKGSLMVVENTGSLYASRDKWNEFYESQYVSSINENSITFGSSLLNQNYLLFKANIEYMWFVAG